MGVGELSLLHWALMVTISIAAPPLCATRISLRRLRSRFDSGSTRPVRSAPHTAARKYWSPYLWKTSRDFDSLLALASFGIVRVAALLLSPLMRSAASSSVSALMV